MWPNSLEEPFWMKKPEAPKPPVIVRKTRVAIVTADTKLQGEIPSYLYDVPNLELRCVTAWSELREAAKIFQQDVVVLEPLFGSNPKEVHKLVANILWTCRRAKIILIAPAGVRPEQKQVTAVLHQPTSRALAEAISWSLRFK